MSRKAIGLLVGAPLVALVVWVASHTYWEDIQLPLPLTGEALANPLYAAGRFTDALGARARTDRFLTVPPSTGVIVLAAWNWNLSPDRRRAIERWVESGGRLVIDRSVIGRGDAYEHWSGIAVRPRTGADPQNAEAPESSEPCRNVTEERNGDRRVDAGAERTRFELCWAPEDSGLTSRKTPEWALRDDRGFQAVRVRIGRGTVTDLNATPFLYRGLLDGDHGRLFVAATDLRRGDEVHLLSEADHPSLLALLWRHGGPVVILVLGLAALILWRGAVRFGPLAPCPSSARRSLADQIRGAGRFAFRYHGDDALHAACVRALDEAARRRVAGYTGRSAAERLAIVADLCGLDRGALAAAVHHPGRSRPGELRNTIALLETARRGILGTHTRSSHGHF